MRRHPGPGRRPFSQVVQTLVPSWCHPGSLSNANSCIHPHSGRTKVPPHEVTGPHRARHTDAQTRVRADWHTPYTHSHRQATLTYTEIPFLTHTEKQVITHTHAFIHLEPSSIIHTCRHTYRHTQACLCPHRHIHTERHFPIGLT